MATQIKILAILTAAAISIPNVATAGAAAERAAGRLLKQRMQNQSPEDLAILEAVTDKQVVVVRGSMDHIEQVLSAAGIPHQVINPNQVARADLNSDQVLMVNCPGNIPQAGVRRVAKFVRAGGLLYTTDWTLRNLVQKAFPGTIAHNGASTGDHVTNVQMHEADDNMMSNMLLRRDSKPQWWLEGGSYPIRVIDKKKVKVLASSHEMKRRYGAAPVVVRFRWDDGEVVHVVSHFYRQVATRGRQVASKQQIGGVQGLTPEQKQSFAAGSSGDVSMSEVESSYAFQQMTSNMVVGKARRNKKLDKGYRYQSKSAVTIEGRKAPAGSRLKLLERKKGKVRVRDDRGNEAWLEDEAVIAR